jgi:hypothetical protein
MVLNCPEWFGSMADCHNDSPILGAIIRPRQRLDVSIVLRDYVQRMISYGMRFSNALKQAGAIVMDPGYLAVLDYIQPFQASTIFNSETL